MNDPATFTPIQTVALTSVLLLAFAASIGMVFNVDAIALSFGVSNTWAGVAASTEMGAIAAGNLLFARFAYRFNPHRVYALGTLAIVAFNAVSLFAVGIWDLLFMRAPAGFALGAVAATVMATAGRSAAPEMTFGIINAMVGVLGMALAWLLPRALYAHEFANLHLPLGGIVWNELDGLYAVYICMSLCALLFIRATPVVALATPNQPGGAQSRLGIGWLALVGIGIVFLGHAATALFLFKIGREALGDEQMVGYVLMAGSGIAIVAPLIAGYVGSRMAPLPPLLVLVGLLASSGLVITQIEGPLAYVLATPVFAVLPVALMPIMLGVLSRFDASGALAGSHPAFVMIAAALAPLLGGALSDWTGNYVANGWFALACFVLGFAFWLPVLARSRPR